MTVVTTKKTATLHKVLYRAPCTLMYWSLPLEALRIEDQGQYRYGKAVTENVHSEDHEVKKT